VTAPPPFPIVYHRGMNEIGSPVQTTVAPRPGPITLQGATVTLQPFDLSHAASLYEITHGPEQEDLWRYMGDGPYSNRAAFDQAFAARQKSTDPYFFTILDNHTGLAVGQASYLRIEPVHRVIEVGNIIFGPALQRSRGATEAMYLMARHAFDDLGYRRYEWKCNALNQPSRRAALRLGFTFEGIFRQHMIIKGRNRDTAWFSIIDEEWPDRRSRLEQWLAPSNFHPDGRQILSLSALNSNVSAKHSSATFR
jgi:RimJ/RimL family protein N-acetyltransferase